MYKLEQIVNTCINEYRKEHNLWDTVEDNATLTRKYIEYITCCGELRINDYLDLILKKKVDPLTTKRNEAAYG